MKDLIIRYRQNDGTVTRKEYDTIMDFIDEMESESKNKPHPDCHVIDYVQFENALISGSGTTIGSLLSHCKEIIR